MTPNAPVATTHDAALVLQADDLALTTSTGLRLIVRSLHVRRFNGRVMIHVGFTNGQGATLRIALGRVQELLDQTTAVLDGHPPSTEDIKS